jgi:hypothetical protein
VISAGLESARHPAAPSPTGDVSAPSRISLSPGARRLLMLVAVVGGFWLLGALLGAQDASARSAAPDAPQTSRTGTAVAHRLADPVDHRSVRGIVRDLTARTAEPALREVRHTVGQVVQAPVHRTVAATRDVLATTHRAVLNTTRRAVQTTVTTVEVTVRAVDHTVLRVTEPLRRLPDIVGSVGTGLTPPSALPVGAAPVTGPAAVASQTAHAADATAMHRVDNVVSSRTDDPTGAHSLEPAGTGRPADRATGVPAPTPSPTAPRIPARPDQPVTPGASTTFHDFSTGVLTPAVTTIPTVALLVGTDERVLSWTFADDPSFSPD